MHLHKKYHYLAARILDLDNLWRSLRGLSTEQKGVLTLPLDLFVIRTFMMIPPDVAGWITIESRGESAHSPERRRHSAEVTRKDPEIISALGPPDIEINALPCHDGRTSRQQEISLENVPRRHDDNPTAASVLQSSDQIQTVWEPYKNRFRVLASCFMAFSNGMNDAAPGALIESIER